MNWKRFLPLVYALGAMLLFAVLVRLTLFTAQSLGFGGDGHGALSTVKTLINLGFDGILVIVTLLLYRWGKIPGLRSLGLRMTPIALRVTTICLGIMVLQYVLVIAISASMGTVWSLGGFRFLNVFRAIVLMLGVGIGEEFFFRGGIFNMLKPYGRLTAYLLSCFIFAQAHFFGEPFHVLRLVGTFLPGLLFIYIYEQSKSIWPGAIVHGAMNLFSLLVIHQVSGVSLFTYTGNEVLVSTVWNISYLLTLGVLAIVIRLIVRDSTSIEASV